MNKKTIINITKKEIAIFILMFLFTILLFNQLLKGHLATDTYNIVDRGYKEYGINYSLNDGRVFMSIISLIANKINLPINTYIITLTMLAIIISNISIILLYNIIAKEKEPKTIFQLVILLLICYCIIFNFMYLENMQFAECMVMSTSILLYIIAANILSNKNKYYLIKATLLVVVGILFYQGTLGFFVVISLLINMIKNKENLIRNLTISGTICIIAVIVNLLQIRISGYIIGMTQVRMGSIRNSVYMILVIANNLASILINTANMFPRYTFIIFFTSINLIILLYKEKKAMAEVVILSIITIFATFAINLFTMAGFGTGRMMFPIGALIGEIFVLIYVKTDLFILKTKYFITAILVIYFSVLSMNYIILIDDHKKVEELTISECNAIKSYIEQYENKTKIKLKYIAIYTDSNPTYFYKEVKNHSALCIRPLSVEWGDNGAINYWCNTKLEEISQNEEIYNKYFKNKDWNSLQKEQVICINDTLHYCIY